MEYLNKNNRKPRIEYPCQWSYRVIGEKEPLIRRAVSKAAGTSNFTLTASKSSSGGRYRSMVFKIRVTSEKERVGIHRTLQNNPAVTFVI